MSQQHMHNIIYSAYRSLFKLLEYTNIWTSQAPINPVSPCTHIFCLITLSSIKYCQDLLRMAAQTLHSFPNICHPATLP